MRSMILCTALLASCATPLTPTQQAAVSAATTLGQIAVSNNTTAASLAQAGQTFCGQAVSAQGVLVGTGIVALANLSGVPVAVTGAAQSDVISACQAVGLVAGGLPATSDPANVPVQNVQTVLPVTNKS